MKVDGYSQVHGPQPIRPPHHLPGVDRAAGVGKGHFAGPVDKVDISPAAQEALRAAEANEARQIHLAGIRRQIADGTYETPDKLDRALERLLSEIG